MHWKVPNSLRSHSCCRLPTTVPMQHRLCRPTHVAQFLPKDGDKAAGEQQDAGVSASRLWQQCASTALGMHYSIQASSCARGLMTSSTSFIHVWKSCLFGPGAACLVQSSRRRSGQQRLRACSAAVWYSSSMPLGCADRPLCPFMCLYAPVCLQPAVPAQPAQPTQPKLDSVC